MKKLLTLVLCLTLAGTAYAEEWTKTHTFKNTMGSETTLSVTYYSAQAVNAQVAAEAQKNLWTTAEAENYRYDLLNQLKLEECIPVKFAVNNAGPKLHLVPFDAQISLQVGKHSLSPMDYDPILNLPVSDKVEGVVWFPRYDDKGKPYITDKDKVVKVTVYNSVAPVVMKDSWSVVFNAGDDDVKLLDMGPAGARREIDRLLKRVDLLKAQQAEAQTKLDSTTKELDEVMARIDELQKQKP